MEIVHPLKEPEINSQISMLVGQNTTNINDSILIKSLIHDM